MRRARPSPIASKGSSFLHRRACRLAHGLKTFLAHPHVPADQGGTSAADELGMGIHGGTDETSVMLHLRPDLVDMHGVERRVPEQLADNQWVRFGGRVSFGWLSNDFFPDGYIGDPTAASAEGESPPAIPATTGTAIPRAPIVATTDTEPSAIAR